MSSACTSRHAGLSTIALSDECTSCDGPRPHFSPLDTSSSSITPFAPSETVTPPSRSCVADGMNTPTVFFSAACTSGAQHQFGDVRRSDFLFAFGDHDEIHRHLLARAADRVQRGEECRFRTFLIHRAAADDDFADAGLVDDFRFERRRGPFRRIELLHVVHEIQADGFLRARIERGEHAGFARRFDRPRLSGIPHRVRAWPCTSAPSSRVAVFRGDGGQGDPVLQPLHRFVVTLGDFALDRARVGRGGVTKKPRTMRRRWQAEGVRRSSEFPVGGRPVDSNGSRARKRRAASVAGDRRVLVLERRRSRPCRPPAAFDATRCAAHARIRRPRPSASRLRSPRSDCPRRASALRRNRRGDASGNRDASRSTGRRDR